MPTMVRKAITRLVPLLLISLAFVQSGAFAAPAEPPAGGPAKQRPPVARANAPDNAVTFANTNQIDINDSNSPPTTSSPYPSTIEVSGLSGRVLNVSVTLHGFGHFYTGDVDMLLVGPDGQKAITLMSDITGSDTSSNLTITFDDAAAAMPESDPLTSGAYSPTDHAGSATGTEGWPAPAPLATAAGLSAFQGDDPNGTWSLYVVDDEEAGEGEISGGWSLAIFTLPAPDGIQIDAGGDQTCELRTDGTPACWGANSVGQATPPGGTFIQVSAGGSHTCGVRTDGTLDCWGYDGDGRATPPGGTFIQVSAGGSHTCGVRTDGTVDCWGLDGSGQATPPGGTFIQVSAGSSHTCGVRTDGTVVCWGNNGSGRATPPGGTFTQVSAGGFHTCGVRTDGTVVCWGANDSEQAPQIAIAPPTLPAGTEGVAYSQQLTASGASTITYTFRVFTGTLPAGLSLNAAGLLSGTPGGGTMGSYPLSMRVTDSNYIAAEKVYTLTINGPATSTPTRTGTSTGTATSTSTSTATPTRTSTGTATGTATPTSTPPGMPNFPQVSAGYDHDCEARTDGTASCWGDNTHGQLNVPANSTFAQIEAGADFTCGLKVGGTVVCWGSNQYAHLNVPANSIFTQIAVNTAHACGLKTDGTLACWGSNQYGQLNVPANTLFSQVTAGEAHTCGLKSDGTIACWGDNFYGQLNNIPGGPFTQVSAGWTHTCGLKADGTVVCWGNDRDGKLNVPANSTFRQIDGGSNHNCGVKTDGKVVCWGNNGNGQLNAPANITFAQVSAGAFNGCGVRTDGTVRCWGFASQIDIQPPTLPGGSEGFPYSRQLSATGGSTITKTFSLYTGTLPVGLTLSANGLLSGTPASVSSGSYPFAVRATDLNNIAGERVYTLTIGIATATPTGTRTTTPTNTRTPLPTPTCPPANIVVGPGRPEHSAPAVLPAKGALPLHVEAIKDSNGVAHPARPSGGISFILDDGTIESTTYNGSPTEQYAAIWLNRFTPPGGTFPLTLDSISIRWPQGNNTVLLGKQVRLLVYLDDNGDGDPADAFLVQQQLVTVDVLGAFQTYPVSIVVGGPGDIYIGFEEFYAEQGFSPPQFTAPFDESSSQGRSWLIVPDVLVPDINNLGNNAFRGTLEDWGMPANLMIRASGDPNCASAHTPTPTRTSTATPESTVLPWTSTATPTYTAVPASSTATRTVAPAATATALACEILFGDVPPDNAFYSFIRCLACRNVISGYADGTFRPFNNVTRGQAAKIIAGAAGFDEEIPGSRQTFADVPSGHTFWLSTERARLHNLISGYDCGGPGEPCDAQGRPYFRPGNNLTRGQAAKVIAGAAGYNEVIPAGRQTFADAPNSSPFWEFIERARLHNLISGYDCGGPGEPCDAQGRPYFRWTNNVTRGQTAKIVGAAFFPNCQAPLAGERGK